MNKEFWLEELTVDEFHERQSSAEHADHNRVLNIMIVVVLAGAKGPSYCYDPGYVEEKTRRYLSSVLPHQVFFVFSLPGSWRSKIETILSVMRLSDISAVYNLCPPLGATPPCVYGFHPHLSEDFFKELSLVDLDELVEIARGC